MIDVTKLMKLFGRDVAKCPRCDSNCNVTIKPCVDANSGHSYGDQPYLECPKCKAKGLFPWSSFLIVPKDS